MFTYDYGIVTLNRVTWKVIPDPSVEQLILKDTSSEEIFNFGKEAFGKLVKRFSSDLLSLVWLFNTYFWGNKVLDRMVGLFNDNNENFSARLMGHIHSPNKTTALAQLMVEQSLNHHAAHEYAEMFENLDIKLEKQAFLRAIGTNAID
jgi:hypothetical protein